MIERLTPEISLSFSKRIVCGNCKHTYLLRCQSGMMRSWIELEQFNMAYRNHLRECKMEEGINAIQTT